MILNFFEILKTVKIGQKFSKPQIIILMGLPGSGKSYVADYLHHQYGFTILSGENISFVFQKNGKTNFALAYQTLRQLAVQLLHDGHSIVIDGTNLTLFHRQQIYTEVCPKIKPILIYLQVDDTVARERLDSRIPNSSDPINITSTCTPETYTNFKAHLDEPLDFEPCFRLVSDNNLLTEIDKIFQV